jgi:hypothetical protein
LSANPVVINLTVSWTPDPSDATKFIPVVSQPQQQVSASPGDLVVIIWGPQNSEIVITSITGFPSVVSVSGPDADGNWMATYQAPASTGRWSYIVSASYAGSTVIRHDPEIDNTPPPAPPG